MGRIAPTTGDLAWHRTWSADSKTPQYLTHLHHAGCA
jgi:hypothetical protein